MIFGIFGDGASAKREDAFWKWFQANDSCLFSWEKDPESTFRTLTEQLGRINADLTFEFGPVVNGRRDFVISASGIKAAFPAVEALYSKAPTMSRWNILKFRQRRMPMQDIEFEGKTVRVEDVRYLMAKDDDKIGLLLFFDGYNEREAAILDQIGYLFLDQALGEYTVEMHVGFIEFRSESSEYFSQSSPLSELPAHFDVHMGRLAR